MPYGKGTYGNKVGRPPMAEKAKGNTLLTGTKKPMAKKKPKY